MRKTISYALVLLLISLTACGQETNTQAVTEASTVDSSEGVASMEASIENSSSAATIDTTEPSESAAAAITAEAPVPFKFLDAFGQEYETTINEDIPKHTYANENFTRDGEVLSYEDDSYTSRFGIDIARHQGKINWQKVKEQGVEFVFIRIGFRGYGKEGAVHLDRRFHENIKGAQEAGLDVGVYFFSQAINEEEALEEAQFVIENLQGYELQLPVVYDPESILDDVARTDDVPGEQFTKNTIVFCNTIRDSGYEPMIYSNMLWEAFEFDLSQLTDIPIWYADYEALPQTPYYFSYWQYTNEGRLSGVDGSVDLDIQMIKK